MNIVCLVSNGHCGYLLKVKKALGWEPVVPLKEGLALMVDDFATRLGKAGYPLRTHLRSNTFKQ